MRRPSTRKLDLSITLLNIREHEDDKGDFVAWCSEENLKNYQCLSTAMSGSQVSRQLGEPIG